MIALLDCPLPGLAHMSGRAGRAVMDMMVGCTAALSCLPLRGFQRTVVHLQRRAGPARHRCPNRPATHSEASMRRTLISYYSFYTQQGSGPVQCGVPYDSWWQLRGSTRLDAVSPGLVNPSPPPFLASTIFCHQPTTSATTPGCNLDGGQQSPNISGMPQYFYICSCFQSTHSPASVTVQPSTGCKSPNMPDAHDPNMSGCNCRGECICARRCTARPERL